MSDNFSSFRDLLGQVLPPPATTAEASTPAVIRSGIQAFDVELGGWRTGEVTLIGGGAGVGKSALLYGATLYAATALRTSVALVPLKHSLSTCAERLLCAHAQVPLARFRAGMLSDQEKSLIPAAAEELEAAPLFIHTAPELSLVDLAAQVRGLVRRRGIRLLAVDGLPALRQESTYASRDTSVTAVVGELGSLAAELDVAIVATVDDLVFSAAALAAGRSLLLERFSAGEADSAVGLRLVGQPRARAATMCLRFQAELLRFVSCEDAAAR